MSPTSYQTALPRDNKKEDKRFELLRRLPGLAVFKTAPFSHLGNPPYVQKPDSSEQMPDGPCRTRTYDRAVMSRLL